MTHSVRAWLRTGPAEQVCGGPRQAALLFDRLRAAYPAIALDRLADGRVVELHRPAQ